MRTLDEVRHEIVHLCVTSDMDPSEAISKLGPFDDLDDDSRNIAIARGLVGLISDDFKWLRAHPVEHDDGTEADHDSVRSYLGRFQLRPNRAATAKSVYANLHARYETADGRHRPLIDFTIGDAQFNAARAKSHIDGLAKRLDLFQCLVDELTAAKKSRISQLPKAVLTKLDELAGKALR